MNGWVFAIFCLFCGVWTGSAQEIRLSFPGRPTSVENFVTEVAAKSESSGSLVLRGTCTEDHGVKAPLPLPPEGPFRNMNDALKKLAHVDAKLRWKRGRKGFFRVQDQSARRDILSLRIASFRIDNALGGDDAVSQLLKAPEIKRALSRYPIDIGRTIKHLGLPSPLLPRYTSDLRNTTVEEALDDIISFYPGIWIYEECDSPSGRRLVIRTFPVRWPSGTERPR